jgi:hypothetical protein
MRASSLHGIRSASWLLALVVACDGGGGRGAANDAAAQEDAAAQDEAAAQDDAAPARDDGAALAPPVFSDTCLFAEAPGRQVRTWGSSGAEIEGPALGEAWVPTASLRKKVAARFIGANPSYELGDAYLVRRQPSNTRADLIATIRYIGPGMACFVRAVDIAWLTATGGVVGPPGAPRGAAFVTGTVGLAGASTASNTCLAAGEVGYIFDTRLAAQVASMYDQTAAVELQITSWMPGAAISASVYATSYVGCASSEAFEVTMESRGPEAAVFGDDFVGTYLLFDEDGAPLAWGILRTRRGLGVYTPGKVMLGGDRLYYDGVGRRMQVLADFTLAPLAARRLGPGLAGEDQVAQLLAQRQEEQRRAVAQLRASVGDAEASGRGRR